MTMNFDEFLRYYISHSPQFMWFLGAGASYSAQIATAQDIINDIKTKLYCQSNHVDISEYAVLNEAKIERINSFFASRGGYPPVGALEEYSYYLEEYFKNDNRAQQAYFQSKVINNNLSSGHKIFAALLELGYIKAVLTTNFDDVIERAFSYMSNKPLSFVYHLEAAHDVVNAVDKEYFPIYIKIHGDFRYTHIKNLSDSLKSQNQELMKAFQKLAVRYGIVFSGYSGRDFSVMEELNKMLEMPNMFPQGIFWLTRKSSDLPEPVHKFIENAKAKGFNAHIIDGAGNYDDVMRRIWELIDNKPQEMQEKVRWSSKHTMSPFKETFGKKFPKLRINAFKILKIPNRIMAVSIPQIKTYKELTTEFSQLSLIFSKGDRILFWGNPAELEKISLPKENLEEMDVPKEFFASKQYQNLILKALMRAMVREKPLSIKRLGTKYFITLSPAIKTGDMIVKTLNSATNHEIQGHIKNMKWQEAVEIHLENIDDTFFIILKPSIWIEPKEAREEYKLFIKSRLKKRSNLYYNKYLDAWSEILFCNIPVTTDHHCLLTPFAHLKSNNPIFEVCPKNCFTGML